MNEYSYSVSGGWQGDDSSPALIAERLLATLDQLEQQDPSMTNWFLLNRSRGPMPLASVRSDLTAWIEQEVVRDDDGTADPRGGFGLSIWGGQTKRWAATPNTMHLSIGAGSQWSNDLRFEIGSYSNVPNDSMISYARFRLVLDVFATIWPCPWASANLFVPNFPPLVAANSPGYKPPPPPPPPDTYFFPWIAYLSATLSAGLTPPDTLEVDATPGGGMILSAAHERLDGDNPEHLRRSRMLQKIIANTVMPRSVVTGSSGLQRRVGPF